MNKNLEKLDEIEIIERYIILFLGVIDRPASLLHLEKEMFILSKANSKISNFIRFIKHYYGPYSDVLNELVRNPVYHVGAYEYDGKKVQLTPKGKEIFNEIVRRYSDVQRFREMLAMMKMIRELYEKLTTDELLFLMYLTYPEYRKRSKVSDELLSDRKRKEIAYRLFQKGLITKERYLEVVSGHV